MKHRGFCPLHFLHHLLSPLSFHIWFSYFINGNVIVLLTFKPLKLYWIYFPLFKSKWHEFMFFGDISHVWLSGSLSSLFSHQLKALLLLLGPVLQLSNHLESLSGIFFLYVFLKFLQSYVLLPEEPVWNIPNWSRNLWWHSIILSTAPLPTSSLCI